MKTAFLLFAAICLSVVTYAQPPGMTIQNTTPCYFTVTFQAAPGCGVMPNCLSPTFCVPPGAVVAVPACGPNFWIWEFATVVPTDPTCTQVCPPTVVSPVPSGCAPPVITAMHCACGAVYNADFTLMPNTLVLW